VVKARFLREKCMADSAMHSHLGLERLEK
jgi:hypothetical protein